MKRLTEVVPPLAVAHWLRGYRPNVVVIANSCPLQSLPVTVHTRSALIEALSGGRPDDLIGTAENWWLDFKTSWEHRCGTARITTSMINGGRAHDEHTTVHTGHEIGSDPRRTPRSEP